MVSQTKWTRRGALTFLGVGAAAPMISACIPPKYTFRYRLTLKIHDKSSVRSGSSVVEVSVQDEPKWAPSEGGLNYEARGEATIVPLKDGRLLIALMRRTYRNPTTNELVPKFDVWTPLPILTRRLGLDDTWRGDRNDALEYLARQKATAPIPVPVDDLPVLIVADDPKNPSSARWVPPSDLAGILGGQRLSANVALTSDPLEFGHVEQVLPWLNNRHEWDGLGPSGYSFGRQAFVRM